MQSLRPQLRRWLLPETGGGPLRRRLTTVRDTQAFDVLFLGRDEFSVAVLEQLHASTDVWHQILIATHPDEKTGRGGSRLSVSPLKRKAIELGIEMHLIPRKKPDFRTWFPPSMFRHASPPLNSVIITASFGRMIPDHVLHLFAPQRRLNVHPSLLPLYRGPAPLQHTIADGREESGVSILEMKEKRFGADVGDIFAKASFSLSRSVRYGELRDRAGSEGGRLLVSVLRDMLSGKAHPIPQDGSLATRAPFITQDTAQVDFETWDAQKLERMDRAIGHQKPMTTTLPSSKMLHLFSPQLCELKDGENLPKQLQALRAPGEATFDPTRRMVAIRCANRTIVYVPFLQTQDKKILEAQEWWNGVWPEWLTGRVITLGGRDPHRS